MKTYYEDSYRIFLPRKCDVIIRVDGRSFHSYTKGYVKPFDDNLIAHMDNVALTLCEEIQGAQFAYVQSDEVSVLVRDSQTINSQAWFGKNLQKMCSISASIATAAFMHSEMLNFDIDSFAVRENKKLPNFDSRVFVIPVWAEVSNYFIWRQVDWQRNSIQMLARSLYSASACHSKNTSELQEMCFQKGRDWNDLMDHLKRGRMIVKKPHEVEFNGEIITRRRWEVETPPVFTSDRDYLHNNLLPVTKS